MPQLSQSLQLKLKQELKLSQKLIQKLELIPMTNFELEEMIENESMINDFLETEKAPEENDDSKEEISDTLDMDKDVLYSQKDWETVRRSKGSRNSGSGSKSSFLENISDDEVDSLKEHLKDEIVIKNLSRREDELAHYFIGMLDVKGFLRYEDQHLTELLIKKDEDTDRLNEKVKKVRNMIMNISPYGAASHDVDQYLRFMYSISDIKDEILEEILEHYLEEISKNRIGFVASKIKAGPKRVVESLERLRDNVRPYPSFGFVESKIEYVKPDATIEADGTIIIHSRFRKVRSINEERFNNYLKRFNDKKTIRFLKKQFEKSKELVENYNSRNNLFEEILKIIYSRQKRFFSGGPLEGLKQVEVADMLDVNVSTISRTVSGKYIRVPSGMMRAGDFFVNIATGETSRDETLMRLLEIIEKEDKRRPLSDQAISKRLKEQFDIDIKRRTVTKYREMENIPSSRERKEFS